MQLTSLFKPAATFLCLLYGVNLVAQDYRVSRTEFDQPDLRGVWNFSSQAPLERPDRYRDQEFLTTAEIADVLERQEASDSPHFCR